MNKEELLRRFGREPGFHLDDPFSWQYFPIIESEEEEEDLNEASEEPKALLMMEEEVIEMKLMCDDKDGRIICFETKKWVPNSDGTFQYGYGFTRNFVKIGIEELKYALILRHRQNFDSNRFRIQKKNREVTFEYDIEHDDNQFFINNFRVWMPSAYFYGNKI